MDIKHKKDTWLNKKLRIFLLVKKGLTVNYLFQPEMSLEKRKII